MVEEADEYRPVLQLSAFYIARWSANEHERSGGEEPASRIGERPQAHSTPLAGQRTSMKNWEGREAASRIVEKGKRSVGSLRWSNPLKTRIAPYC
jgi:hypothetical protein